MKKICNIFLCAMGLLFIGQVVSLQKKVFPTGNFSPVEDWSEESSSEEDDIREFEDDFASTNNSILCFNNLSQSLQSYFIAFSFSEHILEIVPPPPQS
ncbi:MAG TPA: hypothetical protein PLR06_11970 [Cyclobacteriaceae bacterium]|nr:hypothetical protein [Cyclobacteriaceae bacterium]